MRWFRRGRGIGSFEGVGESLVGRRVGWMLWAWLEMWAVSLASW